MQVVLLERIDKLGQMGDVVAVKDGYARNYLVPHGKALRATKANLAEFERRRVQREAANRQRREEAAKLAGRIEGRSVVIVRQAGEGGQLYGSVNARDIAAAFTADGVSIARRQVQLPAALKALGIHEVRIRLHPEVDTFVSVNIARTPEEAEIQADPERAAALAVEQSEQSEQPALATVPPEFEDEAFTDK